MCHTSSDTLPALAASARDTSGLTFALHQLPMNNADESIWTNENEGLYSNFFRIGYNTFEFILDFGQSYIESERESLHTRIVTAPSYAKALIEVLQQSVAEYERKFGPIPPSSGPSEGDETC